MNLKVGDKLKSECVACGEDETWEIESITQEEYNDGMFETFNLVSILNCFGDDGDIRTSVKNCAEVWDMKLYEPISPSEGGNNKKLTNQ